MVPQANSDANHNFEADPIDAFIDGDWVTARGTTLGADNGMGVAVAMALLAATDIEHGPVEALFTRSRCSGRIYGRNDGRAHVCVLERSPLDPFQHAQRALRAL